LLDELLGTSGNKECDVIQSAVPISGDTDMLVSMHIHVTASFTRMMSCNSLFPAQVVMMG
jgi:hypothetical protein